jgi:serine protease Do
MSPRTFRVILYCLVAGVVGLAIGSRVYHSYVAPAPVTAAPSSTTPAAVSAAGLQVTFAPIVDRDLPAVVNISSSKVVRSGGNVPSFMMDPFFRQFFGDDFERQLRRPSQQTERSLGSGVIVRADGYILTNNHVIDGASEITVTLLDKHQYKAKVIGTDSKTDIGVLKIDAKDLPMLAFADSSKVRVGDLALAMGQPFGLGQSVTMGIISAKGRSGLNLGSIDSYEDFIQTDAAINPGNSGGALVDMHGDLVGINTAILTRNGGGNQGVGFAVPINLAKGVMDQVISKGRVSRGYMGVGAEDVTPAMARAFHLTELRGALIGDVYPGPAAQAGIQRGDVISEINGERVDDGSQLRLKVSMMAPGSTVKLKLLHDGAERTVTLKLIEVPNQTAARNDTRDNSGGGTSNALDGMQVEDLNYQYLRQLHLPQSTKGVVVTDIAGGSPAAMAGLQPGDVIQEVDRERITSVADFNRVLRRSQGRTVVMLVNRENRTSYVAVEPR